MVCTYFLAAWAKLRFGGLDWMTSSVLARAIVRRGTDLADLIAGVPYLLIVAQFGIIAFELVEPADLRCSPARWRTRRGRVLLLVPRCHVRDHHDLVRAASGGDDQLPAAGEGSAWCAGRAVSRRAAGDK